MPGKRRGARVMTCDPRVSSVPGRDRERWRWRTGRGDSPGTSSPTRQALASRQLDLVAISRASECAQQFANEPAARNPLDDTGVEAARAVAQAERQLGRPGQRGRQLHTKATSSSRTTTRSARRCSPACRSGARRACARAVLSRRSGWCGPYDPLSCPRSLASSAAPVRRAVRIEGGDRGRHHEGGSASAPSSARGLKAHMFIETGSSPERVVTLPDGSVSRAPLPSRSILVSSTMLFR